MEAHVACCFESIVTIGEREAMRRGPVFCEVVRCDEVRQIDCWSRKVNQSEFDVRTRATRRQKFHERPLLQGGCYGQRTKVVASFVSDLAAGRCKFDQGHGFPCFAEGFATFLVDVKIRTELVGVGVDAQSQMR